MSRLPTRSLLDASTGHLSLKTRERLEVAPQLRDLLAVTKTSHGFIIPSYLGEGELWRDHEEIPGDLLHVLRFAAANGLDTVWFDSDADEIAELPWYGDANAPARLPSGIDPTWPAQDNGLAGVIAIDPALVSFEALRIPPDDRAEQILADGDYRAEAGLWVALNGVVAHLYPTTVEIHGIDGVQIDVHPDAHPEDPDIDPYETCFVSTLVSAEDVREAHENLWQEYHGSPKP